MLEDKVWFEFIVIRLEGWMNWRLRCRNVLLRDSDRDEGRASEKGSKELRRLQDSVWMFSQKDRKKLEKNMEGRD